MPLNPNDTLLNGQYRILRLLGRGGFGFVYQAQDTLLHKEVAIKELIPALVGDESTLKRFLVEARATMELAHECIVRTYNVFHESDNYYIIMECMSGGSLEDRLRERGALPVDEGVRIAAEVCTGLGYAHRCGIVHCDLKPANILFASNGSAKVADFGIAYVSAQMLTRSWVTPSGFVAGTLPYMSPEQADGVREDPRIDLYALGAVLYRMLTGRTYLDFDQRETPGAQADNVLRIRNAQPGLPSAHNPGVPAWLDGVVLKALSKRPDGRYGSAAAMRAALMGQGAASPVPSWAQPVAVSAPVRRRPAKRTRPAKRVAWFWPAVGAAGVLLVATVIALVLLLGGGEPPPTDTLAPEPTRTAVTELAATSTLALLSATPSPTNTPLPPPTVTEPLPSTDVSPARLPNLLQVGAQIEEYYWRTGSEGDQTRTITAIGPEYVTTVRQRGTKSKTMYSDLDSTHYEDSGDNYGSSPWLPQEVFDRLVAGERTVFKNLPADQGVTLDPAVKTSYWAEIDGELVEFEAFQTSSSQGDRYLFLNDRDNPYVLRFEAGGYFYVREVRAFRTGE